MEGFRGVVLATNPTVNGRLREVVLANNPTVNGRLQGGGACY